MTTPISEDFMAQLAILADEGRVGQWSGSQIEGPNARFTEGHLDSLIERDRKSLGHYRFMRRGVSIDPVMMRLVDSEGRLVPERIELLKRQDCTIMVSRLETKIEEIRKLSDRIQAKTASYVRVVGIASFGSTYGMPCHFDHVDVWVLQTDGSKRWNFFGGPIEGSGVNRNVDPEPDELTLSIDLAPGDQLFVPCGVFHQCDPEGFSMHLAINLKWPCALDILGIHYQDDQKYNNALLEPIRVFGQPDRLLTLSDRLSPLLREYSYSGDFKAALMDWPRRCQQKYSLAR